MAEAAAPENRESWDDTQIQFAFNTILHQHGQFRVNSARIVSPPGYQPKEVSVVWESLDPIECRQYIRTRGLVSKRRAWMPMSYENDKNWKYMTYFMSDDCKFCGFVSESIEMDHKRDVIQIESVKYNKAAFCIYLDSDYLHGPVIITGENCHFKMSGENGGRKLIYFAFPNEEQLKTKNRQDRLFVICIYDFETKGVTVIADENICEETINQIEWTPDGRGVIFHRRTELFWYRFGEQYVNKIYSNIPQPLRISFSPDEKRLAVFLPTSVFCEKSILLFHWPFVKAAVQFQHDVITLGSYKVWSVPDRPWSHGGSNLVFNANCQHHVVGFWVFMTKVSVFGVFQDEKFQIN
ncbi:CRE-DPF-7 protein [Caenorhabditis remanei]|uniref:CRE-DPF-7 protein n=1 Tax=Caenorhabditis remanei TaxID=31234 RepID=E3NUN9_CAERE|nr:CRE-DPF-7 protein [Caenorhabditis remanei]